MRVRSAAALTAVMCAAEVLSMTGFAAYTTLLPTLMREWGLSNSEAGAIGGIFYAGYVLAVPVLTSLTDRVDSRRVYVTACLVSSAGAAGFGLLAGGWWGALAFQFLIGAALGGTYMPGLKILTDAVTGPKQSRWLAFYTASFSLGASLSTIATGAIGHAFDPAAAIVTETFLPLLQKCQKLFTITRSTFGATERIELQRRLSQLQRAHKVVQQQ